MRSEKEAVIADEETPTVVAAPADMEVKPRKGVFSFSRSVKVRDYENATAFLSIEFPIDWDDEAEDIIRNAQEAASQVKSLVFEQLGLPFHTDEDGVLLETVVAAPQSQPAAATQPSAPGDATSGPTPPYNIYTTDKGEKEANQRWGQARFASHPNEFWDNRQTKTNDRAPDLKHKDTKMPVWRAS